jgi:hypothetical protein
MLTRQLLLLLLLLRLLRPQQLSKKKVSPALQEEPEIFCKELWMPLVQQRLLKRRLFLPLHQQKLPLLQFVKIKRIFLLCP